MRLSELLPDIGLLSRGASKTEKIAKASARRNVATQRYQAKMRAAHDAAKLASTSDNPIVPIKRDHSVQSKRADAQRVFRNAVAASNNAINKLL